MKQTYKLKTLYSDNQKNKIWKQRLIKQINSVSISKIKSFLESHENSGGFYT